MDQAIGVVQAVQISVRSRQAVRRVDRATAVPGAGLMGCRHSRPGNSRAVLVVQTETLEDLGIGVGEIKENIATRGIELESLPAGSQIAFGATVVLEVTGPCQPCRRMDEIRPGLCAELAGRRGLIGRVLVGGQIQPGDAVSVVSRAQRPEKKLP